MLETYVLGGSFLKTFSLTEQVVSKRFFFLFSEIAFNRLYGLMIKCLIKSLIN